MIKSEDVFQLVKSLNKTEKSYFKKYASPHISGKKNVYIRLFEAIDKQKKYDEDRLKILFGKEKFFNNFSESKSYLYSAILKSLRAYYSGHSQKQYVSELIHTIEILFFKALYTQCHKIIQKAKSIAIKYEMHYQLLEILEWEKSLNVTSKNLSHNSYNEVFRSVQQEEADQLNKIQIVKKYSDLMADIMIRYESKGDIRSSKELKYFEKKMKPLSVQEENLLPVKAAYYYYIALGSLNNIKKNYQQTYYYYKKTVELVERNVVFAEENPGRYRIALSNLLAILGKLKKYDKEFADVLLKMKEIPGKFKSHIMKRQLTSMVFAATVIAELDYYIYRNEFPKINSMISSIQQGLTEHEGKLSKSVTITLYFNIANMYMRLADYKNASFWLQKIINDPYTNLRIDLHSFARIMNLICHYELNNDDILPHLIRSTYRFLRKKEKLFKVEQAVLDFIQKPEYTEKALMNALKELYNDLIDIVEDSFEKEALEYFNLILWLESKIEVLRKL